MTVCAVWKWGGEKSACECFSLQFNSIHSQELAFSFKNFKTLVHSVTSSVLTGKCIARKNWYIYETMHCQARQSLTFLVAHVPGCLRDKSHCQKRDLHGVQKKRRCRHNLLEMYYSVWITISDTTAEWVLILQIAKTVSLTGDGKTLEC